MPKFDLVVSTDVKRSSRVMQLEGLFELPPTKKSELFWVGVLPLEERAWQIGMIVGPSGCGKSTMARGVFGEHLINGFEWDANAAIVDEFPKNMSIKDITGILSQVGFSSPPSWLRPFRCLSNGEQFRVTLARAMSEAQDFFVVDEFTSVVDRTVAQIGSAALAKAIRRGSKQMIAVGVHYDVIEWLQPDWVFEPHLNRFQWRSVQARPAIQLSIVPCDKAAWAIFKKHHYLDTALSASAACFCALYNGQPVAFTAVLHWPHPTASRWREHRTVCLPDFQGVGIGNAMSEYVASLYLATGKPYTSVTSNPAMIQHRARSKNWNMRRGLSRAPQLGRTSTIDMRSTVATSRFTASFDYVGEPRYEDAKLFGVV